MIVRKNVIYVFFNYVFSVSSKFWKIKKLVKAYVILLAMAL